MVTRATDAEADGFTAEERAAMKERAAELRAQKGRRGAADKAAAAEADALEKIAEMPEADRVVAERVHAIVREHAPGLAPRTWYGQPAYAKDGQVVCFFQAASKFGTRYATLGFNESAALDDGPMWPTAFAIAELTDDVVARVTDLVRRAAG
ncbi:iron chaperone [Cellulomonas iranensis]|uniref:Uncharacterized protein YdhG (YjbR/CyaY superfamily) n=1 Tax=Cellulomonas iranensis TaxID=76862 RepID=A0ABU0GFR4_9CELL|nr:DUF1801 domain-containing protein [Cellulomonas iranensis]MDQ0423923.1 uncharacterized protein YdhG (YjbR/CyaY superfamily) [Cellulomonas iranensis]